MSDSILLLGSLGLEPGAESASSSEMTGDSILSLSANKMRARGDGRHLNKKNTQQHFYFMIYDARELKVIIMLSHYNH